MKNSNINSIDELLSELSVVYELNESKVSDMKKDIEHIIYDYLNSELNFHSNNRISINSDSNRMLEMIESAGELILLDSDSVEIARLYKTEDNKYNYNILESVSIELIDSDALLEGWNTDNILGLIPIIDNLKKIVDERG